MLLTNLDPILKFEMQKQLQELILVLKPKLFIDVIKIKRSNWNAKKQLLNVLLKIIKKKYLLNKNRIK